MARAKRHFIPGYIWHITHGCHKGEFLLEFSKDRHRYLQWLYQARKRYGLTVLDYMITSNHIHLGEWTRSIAVGSRSFVENVKALLGFRARGREVLEGSKGYQLREGTGHYKAFSEIENDDIGFANAYFWEIKTE